MKEYIISLDQGTSSSRAIIFDRKGRVVESAQTPLRSFYPQDAWVEQDPMEIWSSQSAVLSEVIAKSGIHPSEIEALAIANQRETTILWDKDTGRPVYNAIVWQCRRTQGMIESLKEKGYEPLIQEKTGLVLDAYFSASKIAWILKHVPEARELMHEKRLLFGTVDTWLLYNLSGKKAHFTDVSNASRTMLLNLDTLDWDDELLEIFGIDRSVLPSIKNSADHFAYANIQGYQIPIRSMVGDQQAALFGQKCYHAGDVKSTYGTGAFVLMNTKDQKVRSKHGLLTTVAVGIDGQVDYALEGSVFMAGALLEWLKDSLNLVDAIEDTEYFASKVEDTAGVYCVPALSGLGAPYWDMNARGAFLGLTQAANKNHLVRSSLESIAYQVYDVIEAMEEDAGIALRQLRVDGGVSKNDFLMQFQSDLLDRSIHRPNMTELTALGAFYLAGIESRLFESRQDIEALDEHKKVWTSQMDSSTRKAKIKDWHLAVSSVLNRL